MDHIVATLDEFGLQAMQWANPDYDIAQRPTRDWAMTRFSQAAGAAAAYLLFVVVGTALMQLIFGKKEPEEKAQRSVLQKFKDEPIVLLQALYNPAQVLLCAYMMYKAVDEYIKGGYSFICNAYNPSASGMAYAVWIFYLSKIFDFFDTIFIVLRRKWRQLSFLHVYHHTSIFLFYWLNINTAYDGDVYYTVILNSFVHLVMYFYYFLKTFNVPVPIVLKELVTNIQLLQFFTMISQAAYLLYRGCPYPPRITAAYFVYIISLIVLFLDFKRKTYSGKKTEGKDKKAGKADGSKKSN